MCHVQGLHAYACLALVGLHKTVSNVWLYYSWLIGEVFGIYVLAGGSKCSVVIADWLVCIGTYLHSGLMAMCFWRSNFRACFSFLCFSVVLVSRWQII